MRLPLLLTFGFSALSFACGSDSGGAASGSAKADGSAAPKKETAKSGAPSASAATKTSAAPASSGSAAASATPDAAPSGSASAPPAGALATFFTGEPDPAIKFLKQKQIPNEPVWIQVVPYWEANTDEPSPNEPYTTLDLRGKDKHAYIGMGLYKADPGNDEKRISNHCSWASANKCTFGAPVDGTLGQGIKVKIAEGTAEVMTKPAKVWWMKGDVQGKELFVFASIRADVWPKLEGETIAMLKSVKVQGPSVK